MNEPSNPRLSERQQDILRFIREFNEAERMPPTFREIMRAVGLASLSSISRQLDILERYGLITRLRAEGSPYLSARSTRLTEAGERWLEVAV